MQDLFEAIRADYESWREFMYEQVSFQREFSTIHGMEHCERVLRLALMIAEAKGLSQAQKDTLATAAVFHDSRRQSDGYDTGHGRRAAEYYRKFCEHADMDFDPVSYEIIAWHDRHDEDGIYALNSACPDRADAVLLYQVFKDADGLDRVRFGPEGVDFDYLRTPEAVAFYSYALALVN